MKKAAPPKTDSIRKLAEFWDTHDLTDFEADLDEVTEPVFARAPRPGPGAATAASSGTIRVPLGRREAEAVGQMARARGVSREELVRTWVLQKIARRPGNSRPSPRARPARQR